MKYKLIGIRPNHQQMVEMVGKHLYRINDNEIDKVYVLNVKIGENYKWQFTLTDESSFKENEPLFISLKSVRRYAKSKGIKLRN